MDGPAHIVVGQLRKPHGIRGEALVYPATDEPDEVFAAGRVLVVLDADGRPAGREVVVSRSRAFHRAWLLHLEGMEDRESVEALRGKYLALRHEDVRPLGDGEYYFHDLVGLRVETGGGEAVGTVSEVVEAPQGLLLLVRDGGKERLVPFTPAFVRRVDREAGLVVIEAPPGFLEV